MNPTNTEYVEGSTYRLCDALCACACCVKLEKYECTDLLNSVSGLEMVSDDSKLYWKGTKLEMCPP